MVLPAGAQSLPSFVRGPVACGERANEEEEGQEEEQQVLRASVAAAAARGKRAGNDAEGGSASLCYQSRERPG